MGWRKVKQGFCIILREEMCVSTLKIHQTTLWQKILLKNEERHRFDLPSFHFSRKIIGCTFLKSGRGLYAWAFPPLILHHRCALQISLSWIDVSLEFLGSSSTLKPRNNEPWYSEFRDIVNKTQLLFWGCTKHITFDIVNYPI